MKKYEFEVKQLFKDLEVIMDFLIKPQPSSQLEEWIVSKDLEIFVWCPPKKCGEDGSTRLKVDKVTEDYWNLHQRGCIKVKVFLSTQLDTTI